MTRPTRERIEEIRVWASGEGPDIDDDVFVDLLAEIDALQAERDHWQRFYGGTREERNRLRAMLGVAREALEFYSDQEEWIDFMATAFSPSLNKRVRVDSHFDGDKGQRARDALAKLEEMEGGETHGKEKGRQESYQD